MGKVDKQLIKDENLTIYAAHGSISGDDVKNAIRAFYEQGPVTKNVLWDVSLAVLQELSSEDVRQIAHVPRKSLDLRKGGKTAIVAPGDLAYGLSRVYQTSSGAEGLPFKLQVFRDAEKARAWLAETEQE
jgi:hypothetical protein